MRAIAATHCKHGHELTPDNVRMRERVRGGKVVRWADCRICHNIACGKYREGHGLVSTKVQRATRGPKFEPDASDPAVQLARSERLRVLARNPWLKAYMEKCA